MRGPSDEARFFYCLDEIPLQLSVRFTQWDDNTPQSGILLSARTLDVRGNLILNSGALPESAETFVFLALFLQEQPCSFHFRVWATPAHPLNSHLDTFILSNFLVLLFVARSRLRSHGSLCSRGSSQVEAAWGLYIWRVPKQASVVWEFQTKWNRWQITIEGKWEAINISYCSLQRMKVLRWAADALRLGASRASLRSPEQRQENLWTETWEFIQGKADTANLLLRLYKPRKCPYYLLHHHDFWQIA